MPITPRPIKVAGTNTYQTEVAAGVPDIIDSELDADFDTLYSVVNGRLDNANLAANAAIAYGKLALTGSIKTSDLAPGAVIVGTAGIADGAVTLPKLAVGATVVTVQQQRRTDELSHGVVATELVYLDMTWVSRGGYFVLLAGLHVTFGVDDALPAPGYVMRARLDGTAGMADGAVQAQQELRDATAAPPTVTFIPTALTLGGAGVALPAGTHRFKVTGQPLNHVAGFAKIASGWGLLVELA